MRRRTGSKEKEMTSQKLKTHHAGSDGGPIAKIITLSLWKFRMPSFSHLVHGYANKAKYNWIIFCSAAETRVKIAGEQVLFQSRMSIPRLKNASAVSCCR